MVRIVSGIAGGRRLAVPPHGTRPTSQRVREAVFSTLQARRGGGLAGARVLDLYAGSGAFGLEALSRGAAHVRFVESDRRTAAVLRRNIAALGLAGREEGTAEVLTADVLTVLRGQRGQPSQPSQPYDVVFADPPYALADAALTKLLQALVGGHWLGPDGVIVLERPAKAAPPVWPQGVRPLTDRRYGDTAVYYGCAP
jgi:16S rRNA (guanine966-N2)-methyltransferase